MKLLTSLALLTLGSTLILFGAYHLADSIQEDEHRYFYVPHRSGVLKVDTQTSRAWFILGNQVTEIANPDQRGK